MKIMEPWIPFAEFLENVWVNHKNQALFLSVLNGEKKVVISEEFFLFNHYMTIEPKHPTIDIIDLLRGHAVTMAFLPFKISITEPLILPENLIKVIDDKIALEVAKNTDFIHPLENYLEISALEDTVANDAAIQFMSINHFSEFDCPSMEDIEEDLIGISQGYHLDRITNCENPNIDRNSFFFTDHHPMAIRMKKQGIAYIFSYRCTHDHVGEFFLVLDLDKVKSTNGKPEKKGKIVGFGTVDRCKLFHVDDILKHFRMICYKEDLSLPDGTKIDDSDTNQLRALLSVKNWKMEIGFEDGSNILHTNIVEFTGSSASGGYM
jgi:hypothetical protein